MRVTIWAIVILGALVALLDVWARKPTKQMRPIVNQEVARQHERLFRPTPIQTHPGIDYISRIEMLGRPVWRGRWTK